MTQIDIISGFSGSGKTTLIQKLLLGLYRREHIFVIQNESGVRTLEASELPDTIQLKNIFNGCLCCSNTRDFEETMKEALESRTFHRIIIEPAGTTRLADLLFLIQEQIKSGLGSIAHVITVVDPASFEMRMKLSEVFFKNQLQHSSAVFFSKTDRVPVTRIIPCQNRILRLKPHCLFLEQDLQNWGNAEFLNFGTALPVTASRSDLNRSISSFMSELVW